MLPLLSAISLLHTVCHLCTSCDPDQPQHRISPGLLASLARLVIAVDTDVAMETKHKSAELVHHVTSQKHTVCVECLLSLPGLYQEVLRTVQQTVMIGLCPELFQSVILSGSVSHLCSCKCSHSVTL